MIKPNKTYSLDTSFIADESILGSRTLVKTGTYADGNCFFHALLRAIDIHYRKQTTHHAHLKIVEKFRKDISEWLSPEIFHTIGKGESRRLHFLTEFNSLLEEEEKIETDDPIMKIIRLILPYEVIQKEILPLVLNIYSDNFHKLFCWETEKFVHNKFAKLSESKKLTTVVCSRMRAYFIDLFQKAHRNALEKFIQSIKKMNEYVDSTQMECISLYTGYNFIFVDENKSDGKYNGISHVVNFDTNRKNLIFLWVDENHFEIIGELENENIINRIFESEDSLVRYLQKLHTE